MGGPGALGRIAPHGPEPRLAVWESAGRASPKTPEHRVFRESIGHPARGPPGVGTFGTLKTLAGFQVSDFYQVSHSERSESLTIPIATANQ